MTVTDKLVERMDDLREVAFSRGYLDGYRDAVAMLDGDFSSDGRLREHAEMLNRFTEKYAEPIPEPQSLKAR